MRKLPSGFKKPSREHRSKYESTSYVQTCQFWQDTWRQQDTKTPMNVNLWVVFQLIWAMFQNGFTFTLKLWSIDLLFVTSDIYSI